METMNHTIGATPDDASWDKLTQKIQDDLDSKNFERSLYAGHIETISRIVQEEMGFVPDIRVATLEDFDTFKRRQKDAAELVKTGKKEDENGFSIQDCIDSMDWAIVDMLTRYGNSPEWGKIERRIAEEKWILLDDVWPFMNPMLMRVRDRFAQEIPVLEK